MRHRHKETFAMQISLLPPKYEIRCWQIIVPLMRRWRPLQAVMRFSYRTVQAGRALFRKAPLASRVLPFAFVAITAVYLAELLLGGK